MRYMIALLGFLLGALPALAQDNYLLKPGDVLRIEVLEDGSLNRDTLILPDGRISMPLAGLVQAGGRSIDAVQAEITDKLAPNFAAPPTVFVGIARLAQPNNLGLGVPAEKPTVSVFILGEAANPGKIGVTPGSTVLQVLAQAGGFSKFAATKRIQLRRAGKVYQFNYKTLESTGDAGFDSVVSEGDVIIIPQRKLFE
ncbi:MAG: sugar transporter [Cereibacter sphaeroides]|uniref:Sugar transporter n=1 Tax=Cereibacter sphaeroides TaxID=1063 RepID=A0A2W5UAA2_CERSP|nr:MAG: sugar transporter [Cereibacter sphaeroides]